MAKYLIAELYRVLSKRSLYIFAGVLAVAYVLFAFIRADGSHSSAIVSDAEQLLLFIPVLLGGYLFAALYNDDLSSKNLTTLVGFGVPKAGIVAAKLMLAALLNVVLYAVIPLFMAAVYALLGNPPTPETLGAVYAVALGPALLSIVYAAISSIVVYGTQRSTFALVLYILLSTSVIDQLLTALLNWDFIASLAPQLSEHLVSNIAFTLMASVAGGEFAWLAFVEWLVYVAVASVLAVLAFKNKELEF